ncbi:MAG TPA: hypothetical protein VMK13_09410 [Streptosporangiaceae bacterium]|nr:hypothetical protein [Streptosporangiaceae bacterium]
MGSALDILLPEPSSSVVAVPPPASGPGYWAGAPSAAYVNGQIYLAYRLRRPLGRGRGYAIAVARSEDGEAFETILTFRKDEFGTESLERPALVRTPDGGWRLYLSCATAGTKHWRVEMMEAAGPGEFDSRTSRVVLPGDAKTGVKDPVIRYRDGLWQLWASCHPLAEPGESDQMVTDYATSPDGIDWTWHGTALSGRPGFWDARGARVTSVYFLSGRILATYDGRATAAQNYEELTGLATGTEPTALVPHGAAPLAVSPLRGGGLRYLDLLPLPDGRHRLYYEMTRADGAHELRTELR